MSRINSLWSHGSLEDYEWFWRAVEGGNRVLVTHELFGWHHHRAGLKRLAAEYRRSARGCAYFIRAHRSSPFARKRLVQAVTLPLVPATSARTSSTEDVEIAWNPEFLREGCAVQDTLLPDRIVIGTASDFAEVTLREIYRPLTDSGAPLIVTDLATAELVKGAANAFLAAKISFINVMADICSVVRGDVQALAGALGLDPRIGQSFLSAGIGYGGACLPKDVRGLSMFAEQSGEQSASELLMLVDSINIARRERVVRLVHEAVADRSVPRQPDCPLSGKRIAVLGAAFKPGTDDIRDSPGLDIACRLGLLGAEVTVYDPIATGNALAAFPELAFADSALEAANDADVVLLVTPWPEFAEISPVAAGAAAASMTVVDACQAIDIGAWREAGWKVLSLTGSHARHSANSTAGNR